MAKFYYDVTQLIHQTGKITGIPRVMNELAIRFWRADGSYVVFISWVKELKQYCEIDLDDTLEHRGHRITYLKKGEPTPKPKARVVYSDDAPTKLSSQAVAKKAINKAAHLSLKAISKINHDFANDVTNRLLLAKMANYKQISFKAGDQIFIPWGEWWDPNFIKFLKRQKQEGVKLVPVIHDIGPMVMPELSGHSTESLTEYCREIVPIADLVLVVSQNTKKDLTNWLQQNELNVPKIEFFRLGDSIEVSKKVRPTDDVFEKSGLKGGDFLLCVGTIEAKKNHFLFYYVYKLAQQKGIKLPKIVMAGRRGWMTENAFEIMSNDPNGDFIFLLNKSDEELAWLYDKCLFTVLPSFYEGWGIPIAESLSRGVPCISSNSSSMPEIAPGITKHFNPYSAPECLAAIEDWLRPGEYEKARKLTKNYKQFSWDDSFKQVQKLTKEIS